MDIRYIEKLFKQIYNTNGKIDFVFTVHEQNDIRAALTILRHMKAKKQIKDYVISNRDAGLIKITGYDPQRGTNYGS